MRLRDQTNRLTVLDVQQLVLDEKLIHHTIDIGEVHGIVDMTIGIVIDPPGTDLLPVPVITARYIRRLGIFWVAQLPILTTVRPVTEPVR